MHSPWSNHVVVIYGMDGGDRTVYANATDHGSQTEKYGTTELAALQMVAQDYGIRVRNARMIQPEGNAPMAVADGPPGISLRAHRCERSGRIA